MERAQTRRRWVEDNGLVTFRVVENGAHLAISAVKNLESRASDSLLTYQSDLAGYIKSDPEFATTPEPIGVSGYAPLIVRAMAEAAAKALVAPMITAAGAIAEFVGRDLAGLSDEIIVENGCDIFLQTKKMSVLEIHAAGEASLSGALRQIAIEIEPEEDGIGVSVLKGTTTDPISFGVADAVVIMSDETALARAVATATGSILKSPDDIERALAFAQSVSGVNGVLIIIKDTMRSCGDIVLV